MAIPKPAANLKLMMIPDEIIETMRPNARQVVVGRNPFKFEPLIIHMELFPMSPKMLIQLVGLLMGPLLFAWFLIFQVVAKRHWGIRRGPGCIPLEQLGRHATHQYKLWKTGSRDTDSPSLFPLFVIAPN